MEKQKYPEVRFSQFHKSWEVQPLNNIFGKIRNAFVGTATPFYVKKGNFYLESNNVKDGKINKKTQIFIDDYFYFKQRDKWLKTDDLVMVQSGHVGHSAVISEELNNSAAHALIMFSDYKVQTNPHFLNYQWQTNSAKKAIEKIATGNTIRHILSSDMKEFLSFFSSYDEQIQIGNFFQNLDQSIALQEKKLAQTQNLKKAMLEKMFPKAGSKQPEIRLKGFSGDWEQQSIGDFTKVGSGARVHKEEWTSSGVPFYRSSDVVSSYKGNDNSKAYIPFSLFEKLIQISGRLEKDDLLVTGGGSIGIPYLVPNNEPLYSKDADLIWIKKSKKFNSQYLYTFFSTSYFRNFIASISHIGTIAHYTIEQVKATPVCLPSIEEQVQIGNFFKQLDETLALQQQQLQTLKKLKQAFLEKMFV